MSEENLSEMEVSGAAEQTNKDIQLIEHELEDLAKNISTIKTALEAREDLNDLSALKDKLNDILSSSLGQVTAELLTRKENFLKRYRQVRFELLLITAREKRGSEATNDVTFGGGLIKLPSFDIPRFTGNIEKWASFKNMFLSLISDTRLKDNDSAKLHFLFQAVSGDARALIENLRDADFQTNWNILTQFYDDPFRRSKVHLDALFKNLQGNLSLRQLLVAYRQHTTGLTAAIKEAGLDPFEQTIIYSFLDKSNKFLRLDWEKSVAEKPTSNLDNFYEFVERRCLASERAGESSRLTQGTAARPSKNSYVFLNRESDEKEKYCKFCASKTHYITSCSDFRKLEVLGRIKFVQSNDLCTVCFRKVPKSCSGGRHCSFKKLFCSVCKRHHNLLLHKKGMNLSALPLHNKKIKVITNSAQTSAPIERSKEHAMSLKVTPQNPSSEDPVYCMFNENIERSVISTYKEPLLATAVVRVRCSNHNNFLEARALLDNGSQPNFISRRLVEKVKPLIIHNKSSVSGIGQSNTIIKKSTYLSIQSCISDFQVNIRCHIVDDILNSMIPTKSFETASWNIPSNTELADPYFNTPADIDILLGLELFWKILGNRRINLGKGLPQLRETRLGWIVAGSVQQTEFAEKTFLFCVQQNDVELLNLMKKFWILETCEELNSPFTEEEVECEDLFKRNTRRLEDGRFLVRLPFKKDAKGLGDSRSRALKRFHHLEKRLENNSSLKKDYSACINDYISLGHMKRIDESKGNSSQAFYMPHHAVFKETSSSTKVRVVFDASMKSSSDVSLNDILMKGPVVQPDLFSILLRFRTHRFAFVADITQMYRMIRVHEDDTVFQRIFWRESPQNELQVFELLTVTFGTKPAPFLATRCLKELALNQGDKYPEAKSALLNDFYVDDVLSGSHTIESALLKRNQLREILSSAGFELKKWCSNEPELLTGLDKEYLETQFPLSLGDKHLIKTLGMLWEPKDDNFKIWFHYDKASKTKTKRQVLSVIASIFDPMGLIGPVTVTAKYFMQLLWKLPNKNEAKTCDKGSSINGNKAEIPKPLRWDDSLPDDYLKDWQNFASSLHFLNTISIPRFLFTKFPISNFELHGFSDASSKAFGAVIYSRSIDTAGNVHVSLVCSKSRIAPLKQQTIARLELCGALLLSELIHKVRTILTTNHRIDLIRLWSDSKITLSWIGSPSTRWNVFVAHRVSKIQSLTKHCIWDYIESASNPADILSRGARPQDLTKNTTWWNGPSVLFETKKPWSTNTNYVPNSAEELEQKPVKTHALVTVINKNPIFSHFGVPKPGRYRTENVLKHGFYKMCRVTAWLLRIRNNHQTYFPKTCGSLKFFEIQGAKIFLIKTAQAENFHREIEILKTGRQVESTSKLRSLNPFLDTENILRVGGRLQNSELPFEQQHPIILHHEHELSKLITLHEHLTHLHAGPSLLKSVLRRKYWILRLNNVVKECILKCHICIRVKAKTQSEMMANLPRSRVVPCRPFEKTGIDYAGPFSVLGRGGRYKVLVKAYIAIFVCFVTKAIHLELVSDLTTQNFLAALTRFVSRRGLCSEIYSDNGSTFIGAHSELKKLYTFLNENSDVIDRFADSKNIQWHFIPPHAPHFGGLWEAGVKSVKRHLKSAISDKTLNFEEFTTLLTQIEACLNSRPLTPESSDSDDLNILTPGHFLIGGPITALPCQPLIQTPENRVKHWRQVQRMTQIFWKRWSTDYLNTLQQRNKWRLIKNEVKTNDLVLIKEDNLPPTKWKLGRIVTLHPGADGLTRVVTIRTNSGLVKRPCTKLVYLPS